ncbi:MAG: 3-methyladenine DNA glycosylase AlkD [Saprospiraceae bacterium]|jgi:3-methyladenine DNA glycosylase AlkD
MTAKEFIDTLREISGEYANSIPKREVFALAKEFQSMPVCEIVELLRDEDYDHRLGAVSILDWKARNKKSSLKEKKDIYEAYITNHDWVDDWGMVDRAAPYVVGGYLFDKERKTLYDLAKSDKPMERRTAIVSTYYFIRQNEIEDTFNIVEILINDKDEYVQKAVGSWLREAGKRDMDKLTGFLDKHAKTMARVYTQV